MIEKSFPVRFGCSLDMGSFSWPSSVGNLAGTRAVLRIGSEASAAIVELDSISPPAKGVFSWDATLRKLTIDVHQDDLAPLGPGPLTIDYQITFFRPDGIAIEGPSGLVQIKPAIGAKV